MRHMNRFNSGEIMRSCFLTFIIGFYRIRGVSISLFILGLFSQISLPEAFAAGSGTSGGGTAVVCRNPQTGKIEGAPELYELFEAEHDPLRHYHIQRGGEPMDAQIESVLNRVSNERGMDVLTVRHALILVNHAWVLTDGQARINMLPDFVPTFLPKDPNCKLEVTAFYDDSNETVEVDSEIFGQMSSADQAALKLHEAIYKVNRTFAQDKNSDRTRSDVAGLFSDRPDLALYMGLKSLAYGEKLDFLNPALLKIIFGNSVLECLDSHSKLTLKIDSDGTALDGTTLTWYAQEFDQEELTSKSQKQKNAFRAPFDLKLSAENDEYGSNLIFSLGDLYTALDPAKPGFAFSANFALDPDSEEIVTPPEPVKAKLSCHLAISSEEGLRSLVP